LLVDDVLLIRQFNTKEFQQRTKEKTKNSTKQEKTINLVTTMPVNYSAQLDNVSIGSDEVTVCISRSGLR